MPNPTILLTESVSVLNTLKFFADNPTLSLFTGIANPFNTIDNELAAVLRYLTLIGGHEEIISINRNLHDSRQTTSYEEIVAGTLQSLHLLYDRLTLLVTESEQSKDPSKLNELKKQIIKLYEPSLLPSQLKELEKLIDKFFYESALSPSKLNELKKQIVKLYEPALSPDELNEFDKLIGQGFYESALSPSKLKELKKLIGQFAEAHMPRAENKAGFKKLIAHKRKIAEAKIVQDIIVKDPNLGQVYKDYQEAKYNVEKARINVAVTIHNIEEAHKKVANNVAAANNKKRNTVEELSVTLAQRVVAEQYKKFLTCLHSYDEMRKATLQDVRDNMQDEIAFEEEKLRRELAARRKKYYRDTFGIDMPDHKSLSAYEVVHDLDADFAHRWAIESLQGASTWDDEKKRYERSAKQLLGYTAQLIAAIVCIGEAVVPAVGMIASTGSVTPMVIATMLGAYTINYMLFVGPLLSVLKCVQSGKLFMDGKGRTLGFDNHLYNLFAVLCCGSTGLVYACLSFNSTTPMFARGLASLASSPALASIPYLMPIAGILAPVLPAVIAVTAWLSLSVLFYEPFIGLAKSDDRKRLLNHFLDGFVSYFKNNYIDVWNEDKHVLLRVGTILINLITMASAIALTSFVIFNSGCMFSAQAASVLAYVLPTLSAATQALMTYTITGLAMITFLPFNARNLSHFVSTVINAAVTLVAAPSSLATRFMAKRFGSGLAADSAIGKYAKEIEDTYTNFRQQFEDNPLRLLTMALARTVTAVVGAGGVLNARGQGLVAQGSPRIVAAGLQQPAFYAAAINSLWPNLRALNEHTETVASEHRALIKACKSVDAPEGLPKVIEKGVEQEYAEVNAVQKTMPSKPKDAAYLKKYEGMKTTMFFKPSRKGSGVGGLVAPLPCEKPDVWLPVRAA